MIDSSSISRSRAASCAVLELRSLRSAGIARFHRYYGPLRHPGRPGLTLAGFRLAVTRRRRWGFPWLRWIPDSRAIVITPVEPRRLVALAFALFLFAAAAFPVIQAGRLPHHPFRGLLGVHCTFRPASSPSRLKRPSTPETSAILSPPPPLRLLTGRNDPCRAGLPPARQQTPFKAYPTCQ